MGCTNETRDLDLFQDMSFAICKRCGGVQLDPYVSPSVVYKNSHGSGTVGKSWAMHHTELSKFILKYAPNEVFEVGASHNFLAQNYLVKNPNATWCIVDPNVDKNEDKISNLKHKKGFFSLSYESDRKYDCIVHSHTFEHFINIRLITQKFFDILNDDGLMIFSVPNLQSHYDYLYTNVMNFEHTIFLSENAVDTVLKNCGFVIEEKKYYQNNHSIFYCCRKKPNLKQNLLHNMYHINKSSLIKWYDHHVNLVNSLNKKINTSDKDLFLFGAHVTSQFLLNFGLNKEKIVCILDNDKNKQGQRLYGTDLLCKSPADALTNNSGAVILRGGVFSKNIQDDILNNISEDIEFIM